MLREGFTCFPWDDMSPAYFMAVGEIQAADGGA